MAYDYDVLTIGLGPAGMAVAAMASAMGLKVCAIEKHKIGGECMNCGCIPSKALLRMAHTRHMFSRLDAMELTSSPLPETKQPFRRIQDYLSFINDKKTMKMFTKVDLRLGKGSAVFTDPHTVSLGQERITAKRVFICSGSQPMVPPIPGLADLDYLTNTNIFTLEKIPESLVIIGGGAIGCEMAQAFSRLGSRVTIVHMDAHLIPVGNRAPGLLLEEVFLKEGIRVYNGRTITRAEKQGADIVLHTNQNEEIRGRRLLVAAGRKANTEGLGLDKAGIAYSKKGITVNKHLQTNRRGVYAVGDVNGHFLLSHAAMHQGMIALMNSMLPYGFKRNFKKYVVPWTVFTDPAVSHVGMTERQLERSGLTFEVTESRYEDYGAAIAEDVAIGYVQAFASPMGRIYGAGIVGEGAADMINEWGLAIQKRMRLADIMMLQHSFPSMSFLNKRVGETWMMGKLAPWLQRLIRWWF